MKLVDIITNLGFSDKEAKIYIASLDKGESTISNLARLTGLNRATTHLIVEHMLGQGYLASVRRNNHRFIIPAHPRRLLQLVDFRKREIEGIFPQLVAKYHAVQEKSAVQIFEGSEGVLALYEEIYRSLINNHELLGMARIEVLHKIVPESLLEYQRLLKRVKNPVIRELHYGLAQAKHWKREILPYMGSHHHVHAIEHEIPFGFSDCVIYEDTMAFFSLTENAPFVIVITDPHIVQTQRSLFEFIWKNSQDVIV